MKRVYTLLFVAILSLTAVSCFKDKGNYDYTPENRFEVTLQPEINNNEETYWVIKPTNAPDSVPFTVSVSQTLAADSTNLEVSWIILENETEERDTAYENATRRTVSAIRSSSPWVQIGIMRLPFLSMMT